MCLPLFRIFRKFGLTKRIGLLAALAVCSIILGILIAIFFTTFFNFIIDTQIVLKPSSKIFKWWVKPPVTPQISVYIYNVTNSDEFLNNTKPIIQELGPYIYKQKWEKKNIIFHNNGTLTFNQEKIYWFDEELSAGSEDDVVLVPNVPMLSATSKSKHAHSSLREALQGIIGNLKIKPFVEVSVRQLLWGYEDRLLKLALYTLPEAQKPPSEVFGFMHNKNGTSKDNVTMFTGRSDITKLGLVNMVNGMDKLPHYKTDQCNSIMGSDGSIFPPHITKNTTLYLFDKDLCRVLPMRFDKEIRASGNVPGFRFSPPKNVFESPENYPFNDCFCTSGPPCTPAGFFSVSLCQYDSPVLLSFPHFYLADDSYRTVFDGISPPDPEKHKFYMDVQPLMGAGLSAKARIQINLAVSQVVDIKQVATFPDIIFPIIWFEEGIEGLPEEVSSLMALASSIPPVLRAVLTGTLFMIGLTLLCIALWRLFGGTKRLSPLQLATSHVLVSVESKQRQLV